MGSEHYVTATAVLEPKLLGQVQRRLDYRRATLTVERQLYAPLNTTEEPLGSVIAHKVRVAMLQQHKRQLYVHGATAARRAERCEVAQALLDAGHSRQAVGDVLGVTAQTLRNWGCESSRKPGAAGHAKVDFDNEPADVIARGIGVLMATVGGTRRGRIESADTDQDRVRVLADAWRKRVSYVQRRVVLAGRAASTLADMGVEIADDGA